MPMRYFDRPELAQRYHDYRPRLHARALLEVAAKRPHRVVNTALDAACGTGHSVAALKMLASAVYGCDVSVAMLAIARERERGLPLVCCQAEALPFASHVFDLVTVSMAFHWLDQQTFLSESRRVLATNGELWVYNFVFPGILFGDDTFFSWNRERYLARYPIPSRNSEPLVHLLNRPDSPLVYIDAHDVKYEVSFTASGLRKYLTTQSNVEAALHRGDSLRDVDAWLDKELAPFFGGAHCRRFAYIGRVEIAGAA